MMAQNTDKPKEKDVTARISATADIGITKKLGVSLSQQVRLNQQLGNLNSYLTEASVGYNFLKWLSASANYRFTHRLEPETNDKHRVYVIVGTEYQIDPIKIELGARLRVEKEWTVDEPGVEDDLRPRLSAAYKNKKFPIEPSVSAELFYTKTPEETKFVFARYRLRAALDYPITKKHIITGSYAYQSEEKKKSIDVIHIIGIAYTYKLNLYKKDKKNKSKTPIDSPS